MTLTPRRLDRNRPFGEIFPRDGRAAYVQDNVHFDYHGCCLEDETPTDGNENGPPKGPVSLSGDGDPLPPKPPAPPAMTLTPRRLDEWTTMHWFTLRGQMHKEFGILPANKAAAFAELDKRGLVVKE